MSRISLADALSSNRLDDFIEQAEAEGVGPTDRARFDNLMGQITAPQPEDQTSRSPDDGLKRGK